MEVQCCVCHRVRAQEGWVEAAAPCSQTDHVSHGYCPRCAHRAMEEIRAYHAPQQPRRAAALVANL